MPLNAKADLLQRIEKQFHPDVVETLVQNTIQSVRKVTPNEVSYAGIYIYSGISSSTLLIWDHSCRKGLHLIC